jgi:large subunit ribosomal protein L25
MEEVVLKAKRRSLVGKQVHSLRNQGELPAVVYGSGIEATPISLDQREASRVLGSLAVSALITLDIEGDRHVTMVREKQRNPLTGFLRHVDFLAISMREKLKVAISIALTGEAPAVEEFGGILGFTMETVHVEALPSDLPESIQLDISSLREIGDSLHVRDLVVPPNVVILDDPDAMVANITAQAAEIEEEVEEEVEEEEFEPEVIERGKREEEGE